MVFKSNNNSFFFKKFLARRGILVLTRTEIMQNIKLAIKLAENTEKIIFKIREK